MKTGRPKKPVVLSAENRQQLETITQSRALPHGLVMRARIILLTATGVSNSAIAKKLGFSQQSVCTWRKRYLERGLQGLHDELKPGRPRRVSDEKVALLVRKTINTKPKDATHWSVRSIGRETGISHATVQRIWHAFGLQPHRQEQFKISNDPFFVEKV